MKRIAKLMLVLIVVAAAFLAVPVAAYVVTNADIKNAPDATFFLTDCPANGGVLHDGLQNGYQEMIGAPEKNMLPTEIFLGYSNGTSMNDQSLGYTKYIPGQSRRAQDILRMKQFYWARLHSAGYQ